MNKSDWIQLGSVIFFGAGCGLIFATGLMMLHWPEKATLGIKIASAIVGAIMLWMVSPRKATRRSLAA